MASLGQLDSIDGIGFTYVTHTAHINLITRGIDWTFANLNNDCFRVERINITWEYDTADGPHTWRQVPGSWSLVVRKRRADGSWFRSTRTMFPLETGRNDLPSSVMVEVNRLVLRLDPRPFAPEPQ
jgi:hypothetical protein